MRKRREPIDCSSAETLIEAYLDDEIAAGDRAAFETHLARCESCTGDLALARRIQGELRELPPLACPPAVSRKVLDHAAAHPPWSQRLRSWWSVKLWQPAFALLLAAALGVGYWRLSEPPPPPDASPYSEAEIARAEAELKLALAYLGDISQKASDSFGTELGNRVLAPVGRSLAGALLPQLQGETPKPAAEGGSDRDVS